MKTKNILKYMLLCLCPAFCTCNDFLKVETDNVLDHGKYIDEESEMYAGYIGIMTKVQAIGDKVIYLTDMRGEMLEPTRNTPNDLYSLYNYETDLTGNTYADPAGYYDVIIACNDYLLKLYDYKQKNTAIINLSHYEALVSCALRVKAWTYLTLGKIYGQAVWFDDPLREKKDLSQFPLKNLDEIVDACKNLLSKGFDGINGKITMSWKEWLDPNTDLASSIYRYWDCMTPEYFPLYAELCLWSGNYKEAKNTLLSAMNNKFGSTNSNSVDWLRNADNMEFVRFWNSANPYRPETVSAIIYDYSKNQTNSLLKHFGTEYPNEYLLAPSDSGMYRFSNPAFNNLGGASSDNRKNATFKQDSRGDYYVCKYRPNNSVRANPYQDDVHIYIYRAGELYFMLAEALNNLGEYESAFELINQGISYYFPGGGVTLDGFTDAWTTKTPTGTRTYADRGVRGVFGLGDRTFAKGTVAEEKTKANDLAILDEMMLEFACEGKIYPAMIRMAKRYNDYNIIADRVCPKYGNDGSIREKIVAGGYFVSWDLKNK
jgi:hypothetical protein